MRRSSTMVFAGIIIIILVYSSCEKVVFPELEVIPPDSTIVISYADTIQPIWDDKCVSCHAGSRDPDLRPGFSYNALISGGYVDTNNARNSELVKTLYEGSHNERATLAQKLLVQAWMEQGAKNN